MNSFLVVALLAHAADAGVPLEFAPVTLDSPQAQLLDIRSIEAGAPAPAAGCWLDDKACISVAKRVAAAEAERDELRKATTPLPWLLVGAAFLLGAGAGILIYTQVKR